MILQVILVALCLCLYLFGGAFVSTVVIPDEWFDFRRGDYSDVFEWLLFALWPISAVAAALYYIFKPIWKKIRKIDNEFFDYTDVD
jgi:uncharacterized protein involved in cysteine biosynthesis